MPKIFSESDRVVIRNSLLEIGLNMLESRNYQGISVDDIAAAGGIAKGTFYHFFPSKDQFFYAVIIKLMEEDRLRLEELFSGESVSRGDLQSYLMTRYCGGRSVYDYFSLDDMRRIMRTFPTEGPSSGSDVFAARLLEGIPLGAQCRMDVVVNLCNVLAATSAQFRKLNVTGKSETMEVLVDAMLDYLFGMN